MLLNDFFKILKTEQEGNKIFYQIELDAKHKIFSGHFPGNPVTPGVVQIQIVKEILESFHKKELRLSSMTRCNFLKILNPNETPQLTIEISHSEDPLHISAIGKHNADNYFKLSAVFTDGHQAN